MKFLARVCDGGSCSVIIGEKDWRRAWGGFGRRYRRAERSIDLLGTAGDRTVGSEIMDINQVDLEIYEAPEGITKLGLDRSP